MSVVLLLLFLLGAAALYRYLYGVPRVFSGMVLPQHRVELDDGRVLEGPNKTLGAGAFGDVQQFSLNGQPVAVKIPKLTAYNALQEREIDLLKKVSPHPHVLQYIQHVNVKNKLWVIVGLMKGTLHDMLVQNPHLSWRTKLSIARQIVSGLVHLHFFNKGTDGWMKKAIVHQDLKPENLLVDGFDSLVRVRIGDFGLARQHEHVNLPIVRNLYSKKHHGKVGGTLLYTAPEVVQAMILGFDHCNPKLDIFSLGIILWEIATCSRPIRTEQEIVDGRFEAFNRDKDLAKRTAPATPLFSMPSIFTTSTSEKPNLKYLQASFFGETINQCINVSPGQRCSAEGAEESLKNISL